MDRLDIYIDKTIEDIDTSYRALSGHFLSRPIEVWRYIGIIKFIGFHAIIKSESYAAVKSHFENKMSLWHNADPEFKKSDTIIHEFGGGGGVCDCLDIESINESTIFRFKANNYYGKNSNGDYKKVVNGELADLTEEEIAEIEQVEPVN